MLALRRLKQEFTEFRASLGYKAKACFNNNKW